LQRGVVMELTPIEFKKDTEKIIPYSEYPYAVYVRISTDKEEQMTSPENQIEICRNWLEKNNYEWNDGSVLYDEQSGTVLIDRAAMQLILEKARRREIKMVVFKSISRLARDLKDALDIKETLISHGVRLVTIEEGYDSLYEGKNDMKFEIFSLFAAQYPKTLSVSISAALAAKVRRGEAIGPAPFGYKIEGENLVINEEEAPTIRQIFKWYVEDGYGFKSITKMLNEEMIKGNVSRPRKKDKWQVTSVQRIIKNPTYAGYFVHGRYTTVKQNGRKKFIENPREKWMVYENHHPAIIPKEMWEAANNKRVKKVKTKVTPWNEFRGIAKCSECGSNMVIIQTGNKKNKGGHWNYIKCSSYRRAGQYGCVNHAPILYEDFRELIIKRLKRKGKNIKLKLESGIVQKRKNEIAALEKEKLSLEQKRKRLIDLYLEDGLISKEEFQEKRKQYEDRIREIEDRIFLLSQEQNTTKEIKTIEDAFQQLENIDQDLYHVFKTLIDQIIVHPDGKIEILYKFKV